MTPCKNNMESFRQILNPASTQIVLPYKQPLVERHYTYERGKDGDVEEEARLVKRMEELGIANSKRHIEEQVKKRLQKEVEKDAIVGAMNETRRQRPLRCRANNVLEEIKNVIQSEIVRSSEGHRQLFRVSILMGQFTSDVQFDVQNQEVRVTGKSLARAILTKEITVEFPLTVDMTLMTCSYKAGVAKMEVPFWSHGRSAIRSSQSAILSRRPIQNSSHSDDVISTTSESDSVSMTSDSDVTGL